MWSCIIPGGVEAQQVSEYHIKAVFLTNLTHFVTWPEGEITESDSPFIIGILGPDPFGSILDKAVAGETKNGRQLKVERYGDIGEIDTRRCAILFLHDSKVQEWKQIKDELISRPILTVADTDGFPEQGGMVNLLKSGQKIQVEINHGAAKRSGLAISSKLLSLAKIIQ